MMNFAVFFPLVIPPLLVDCVRPKVNANRQTSHSDHSRSNCEAKRTTRKTNSTDTLCSRNHATCSDATATRYRCCGHHTSSRRSSNNTTRAESERNDCPCDNSWTGDSADHNSTRNKIWEGNE